LSEVSGDKADRKFIEKEAKEGYKFISYMSNTIDDFSNFFKPSKIKESFSVVSMCKEAITLSEASLKNTEIDLSLHVKQDGRIYGYPSEYAQVVLNLILNAKDVLCEREIKNPKIQIIVSVCDKKSFVRVYDNAGGVDENLLDRIYEPYFSTKKLSGTGLGLYMSKMIIEENMGGELFAKNSKEGAVFHIKVCIE